MEKTEMWSSYRIYPTVIFALMAIVTLISGFSTGVILTTILCGVIYLAFAVSCFLVKPIFAMASAGAYAVYDIAAVINTLVQIDTQNFMSGILSIFSIFPAAAILLLAILAWKKHELVKKIWFLGVVTELLHMVLKIISGCINAESSVIIVILGIFIPGILRLCAFMLFGLWCKEYAFPQKHKPLDKAQKNKIIAFIVAALLIAGIIVIGENFSGGGGGNQYSDSTPSSSTCSFCGRSFTDWDNKKSIARTHMCSNCYNNYDSLKGYLGQ